MDTAIRVRRLSFAYGDHQVLNGIDLEIPRGQIVALLGPNGAGKTTLVELLIGSLSPQGGVVEVLGRDPRETSTEWIGEVGLVMQHYSDHGKWKVREFLAWVYSHYEGRPVAPLTMEEVLARVSMADMTDKSLGQLSGGQRRRIDMAAAIMGHPKVLLLDEPTTGLDLRSRREFHSIVQETVERGATVLLTTHDMSEASELADSVLILHQGGILAQGSPQELRDQLIQPSHVTWFENGRRQVHVTTEPEQFLLTLDLNSITGLEVARPTLGDAYLALVHPDSQEGTDHV